MANLCLQVLSDQTISKKNVLTLLKDEKRQKYLFMAIKQAIHTSNKWSFNRVDKMLKKIELNRDKLMNSEIKGLEISESGPYGEGNLS
jgi:hypothetical protein